MALFSKTELKIIEAIVQGKTPGPKEASAKDLLALQERLNASELREIPEKFRLLTGWSSKPSEYPG